MIQDAPEVLPVPAGRPGPRPRGLVWQVGLLVCVLLVLAYLTQRYWPTVRGGAVRLTVADQGWLSVGAVAAVGTWAASALAQQGAVVERLPGVRLVAAQFAACAANHLLPAGIGAGAVNLRFLMRCGLPMGRSASALAVKGGAGGVSKLLLIALLVPFCPGLLRVPELPLVWLTGALGAALLVAAVAAGPLWPRCRRVLGALLADVRAVHARPARAAALWGGSSASPRCTARCWSRWRAPSRCRCPRPRWPCSTSPPAARPPCCPHPAGSARWTRRSSSRSPRPARPPPRPPPPCSATAC